MLEYFKTNRMIYTTNEIEMLDDFRKHLLKSKINKLKPHYKEVIELRFFNELTYKEISSKLNQPISNIKVKVLRAKKILSQLIQENV